jgi:hypothetical protein
MTTRSNNRDLISRRHFFHAAGAFAGMAIATHAWADGLLKPSLPGQPVDRGRPSLMVGRLQSNQQKVGWQTSEQQSVGHETPLSLFSL